MAEQGDVGHRHQQRERTVFDEEGTPPPAELSSDTGEHDRHQLSALAAGPSMFMTFCPTLPIAATVAVAIRKTINEYSIAVAARLSDLRRRMSDSISRLRENPVQSSACAGADNVRLVTLVKFVAARWFEQKWAAVAGRPSFRSLSWPQRLVHRVGDVAE